MFQFQCPDRELQTRVPEFTDHTRAVISPQRTNEHQDGRPEVQPAHGYGLPDTNNSREYGRPDVHTAHDYAPPEYPLVLPSAPPLNDVQPDAPNNPESVDKGLPPPPSYDFVMENTDVFKVTS